MCRSRHLANAHEVKLVQLIQSLCAVCGSNVAVLNLSLYSVALRGGCCTVLIARFDGNYINEDYYHSIALLFIATSLDRAVKI